MEDSVQDQKNEQVQYLISETNNNYDHNQFHPTVHNESVTSNINNVNTLQDINNLSDHNNNNNNTLLTLENSEKRIDNLPNINSENFNNVINLTPNSSENMNNHNNQQTPSSPLNISEQADEFKNNPVAFPNNDMRRLSFGINVSQVSPNSKNQVPSIQEYSVPSRSTSQTNRQLLAAAANINTESMHSPSSVSLNKAQTPKAAEQIHRRKSSVTPTPKSLNGAGKSFGPKARQPSVDVDAEKREWAKNMNSLVLKSSAKGQAMAAARRYSVVAVSTKIDEIIQELEPTSELTSPVSFVSPPPLITEETVDVQKRAVRDKLMRSSVSITNWRPYDKNNKTEVLVNTKNIAPELIAHHKNTNMAAHNPLKNNYEANNFDAFLKTTRALKSSQSMQNSSNNNNNNNNSTSRITGIATSCWPLSIQCLPAKEIKIRSHRLARIIGKIMNSRIYLAIGIILTIYSLFIHDIDICVMPKTADSGISISLLVIFSLFSIEILVNCIIKANYIFSFYFCLDLIGTFSLLFDIDFIFDSIFNVNALSTTSTNIGVNGQVSRSASILRITKFARILRILRIVRVLRIFKFNNTVNTLRQAQPTKIGLNLAELLDKRIVTMMFFMLIVLPFLSVSTDDTLINDMTVELLTLENDPIMQQNIVNSYFNYGTNCFYIEIINQLGTKIFIDQRDQYNYLRTSEIETYTYNQSILIISVRSAIYNESLYSIILTLLIITMFVIASLVISRDVHKLLVAPLERTQLIIKKLAGTICFLGSNSKSSNDDNDNIEKLNGEQLETDLIENIITKMASIFNVRPDTESGAPKPIIQLTGSKLTEIQTNNSVLSIEVVERPRLKEIEDAAQQLTVAEKNSNNNSPNHKTLTYHPMSSPNINTLSVPVDPHNNNETIAYIPPNPSIHMELSSMESILSFEALFPHFRLYLESSLLVENVLFFQEVDRYRSIVRLHALNLYNAFISPKSNNPINLSSKQREIIRSQLEEPSINIFAVAEYEVLQLMQGHLNSFSHSKFCQAYLRKRRKKHNIPQDRIHYGYTGLHASMNPKSPIHHNIHSTKNSNLHNITPVNKTIATNNNINNSNNNNTNNTRSVADTSEYDQKAHQNNNLNLFISSEAATVQPSISGNGHYTPLSPSARNSKILIPGSITEEEEKQ